jgi:hypothetical protein
MNWRVAEVMILTSLDVELFMKCPVFLEARATEAASRKTHAKDLPGTDREKLRRI